MSVVAILFLHIHPTRCTNSVYESHHHHKRQKDMRVVFYFDIDILCKYVFYTKKKFDCGRLLYIILLFVTVPCLSVLQMFVPHFLRPT